MTISNFRTLVAGGILAASIVFHGELPARAADCGASPAPGVDWQDCRKRNLILGAVDLSGANLEDVDFSSTDLRRAKLVKSNLTKATLIRAYFDEASAAGANFEQAVGYRSSFARADLANANFSKSEMPRADFSNANLGNADFEKSELGRVDFSGSVLGNTNFEYANLSRVDLTDAKFGGPIALKGAYLFLAKLQGADLAQATGLEQWQVDMACGNSETVLPEGLSPPADWPCNEDE